MAYQGQGSITLIDVSDGTSGTTYYTYILYSSKATPTSADDVSDNPSGKEYIGIQTTTESSVPLWNDDDWVWIKYVGEDGEPGEPGTPGVSVTGVKEVYYLTTGTAPAQNTLVNGTAIVSTSTNTDIWTTVVPNYVSGGTYYTSIQTSLSSGTSPIFSTIIANQGLTDSNSNALSAITLARAQEQHFWFLSSDLSTTFKSGAYITDTAIDTFKQGKSGGYLLARSDGIEFGKGTNKYIDLIATGTSADALNFYKPDGTTAAALDGNGLVVQKGGIIAGNYTTNPTEFIYLSTEDYSGSPTITINGNSEGWRQIIGNKFGVKNDGTLYASNAEISGKITSSEGQIGPWFINANSISRNANGTAAGSYNTASNLYFGTNGISLGTTFRVDSSGTLTATSGVIGGWNIGTDTNKSLYYGNQTPGATTTNLVLSPISATNSNAIGGSGTGLAWFLSAGRSFGVTKDGVLYASGGKFNGTIEATDGYIANSVTIGSGGTTLATIDQNTKIYQIGGNGTAGYHFLGTLKLNGQTDEADIEIHTGDGQNNNAYQNLTIRVNIKRGWQGESSGITDATAAGITVRYENDPTIVTSQSDFQIKVTCTNGYAQGLFNIYLYSTKSYTDGWYQVRGRGYTWTHSGAYGNDATPTGVEQTNIRTMNPYTTATNYLNFNTNDGLTVGYTGENNKIKINGTGMYLYTGGVETGYFTSSGARIGSTIDGVSRVEITSSGIDFIRKNSNMDYVLAHIGDASTIGGTTSVTQPYYTFGARLGDASTIGAWSTVLGRNLTASKLGSVAEGDATESHGRGSHSEGIGSKAIGEASHAQNIGTTAEGDYQTVLGKYNVSKTDYALIIGNGAGSGSNSYSNALKVDWNGNVFLQGGVRWNCIDSSNTINPNDGSALYQMFSVSGVNIASADSLAAGDYKTYTYTYTRLGYYPLCVARINSSGSNSTFCSIIRYGLTSQSAESCDISVTVRNVASSSAATLTLAVYVLWVRIA